MSDEPDVVWLQTVDQGTWEARVERLSGYQGELIVRNVKADREIFREEVGMSYQAMFGPDVDDVAQWQDKVIEVIDAQPKEE